MWHGRRAGGPRRSSISRSAMSHRVGGSSRSRQGGGTAVRCSAVPKPCSSIRHFGARVDALVCEPRRTAPFLAPSVVTRPSPVRRAAFRARASPNVSASMATHARGIDAVRRLRNMEDARHPDPCSILRTCAVVPSRSGRKRRVAPPVRGIARSRARICHELDNPVALFGRATWALGCLGLHPGHPMPSRRFRGATGLSGGREGRGSHKRYAVVLTDRSPPHHADSPGDLWRGEPESCTQG